MINGEAGGGKVHRISTLDCIPVRHCGALTLAGGQVPPKAAPPLPFLDRGEQI